MENVNCPLCGGKPYEVVLRGRDRMLGKPGEFRLAKCLACGLHYLNPRPTPDELAGYYGEGYLSHIDRGSKQRAQLRQDFRKLRDRIEISILQEFLGYPAPSGGEHLWKKLLLAPLFLRFKTHERNWQKLPYHGAGVLLDVGCGTGRFLEKMGAYGWKAQGIDTSPTAIEKAKEKGLDVTLGDLLESRRYDAASFDVITMWDVLEHLPSPLEALRRIHALLKSNGRLVVATPNIDSLPARILKENWFPLEIPRHLALYSPRTITSLLGKAGFVVDEIRFRRRGTGILQSIPYLPDGRMKTLVGLFRIRWVRKLSGALLALTRQSDEIVVFATKFATKAQSHDKEQA